MKTLRNSFEVNPMVKHSSSKDSIQIKIPIKIIYNIPIELNDELKR